MAPQRGGEETRMAGAAAWPATALDVGGAVVAVRRAGPGGRRVLYLHDAGADALASPAFDDLAADHELVVPDLPGYGGSAPARGLTGPADVADLLAGLLEALGWPSATVAGTSLGAWFALELALAHPDRVDALLLDGAAGLHVPQDFLFALFADGRAAAGTEELVAAALLQHAAPAGGAPTGGATAAEVAPWLQDLAAAAAATWDPHLADPRLAGRLEGIRCPTIVLWGEHDALIPLSHGRLLAGRIPDAALDVVRGGDHLVCLTTPDRFVAALRRLTGSGGGSALLRPRPRRAYPATIHRSAPG